MSQTTFEEPMDATAVSYVWCDICGLERPAKGSTITMYSIVICAECDQLEHDEIERRYRARIQGEH